MPPPTTVSNPLLTLSPILTRSVPALTNSIWALPSDSTRKSTSPLASFITTESFAVPEIKALAPPIVKLLAVRFSVVAVPFEAVMLRVSVPSKLMRPSLPAPRKICLLSPSAMVELNVAAPADDISRVRAVTSEPPSLPLNNISLSETADLITKSVEEFNILPNSVPPSLNWNPPLSESNIMSDATSIVKVPVATSILFVVIARFVPKVNDSALASHVSFAVVPVSSKKTMLSNVIPVRLTPIALVTAFSASLNSCILKSSPS